jgi:hypothetical protein
MSSSLQRLEPTCLAGIGRSRTIDRARYHAATTRLLQWRSRRQQVCGPHCHFMNHVLGCETTATRHRSPRRRDQTTRSLGLAKRWCQGLCADGQGKEIMLSTAPALLCGRVLVTGNGGDYVWDMNPESVSTDLAHDEYAGLSLTEFRLHCGFVHFPLPYMGMPQVADICRISQSPEMSQWHIGGSYSRPICRRVLEERGVPREVFGIRKTGASVRFVIGQDPWSFEGHKAFLYWILTASVLSDQRWTRRAWLATLLIFLRLDLTLGSITPRTFGQAVNTICPRIVTRLRRCGVEDYAFLWGIFCIRQSYQGSDTYRLNCDPNSNARNS